MASSGLIVDITFYLRLKMASSGIAYAIFRHLQASLTPSSTWNKN